MSSSRISAAPGRCRGRRRVTRTTRWPCRTRCRNSWNCSVVWRPISPRSFGEPSRADRYLVKVKVLGQDTDFRLAKTVQDPEFDLNTFTTGARVQVQVVAANGAGESAPSPVTEVVVG